MKQKKVKKGSRPFFFRVFACFMVVWMVTLGITLAMTLYFSLSTFQTQVENVLTATARSLASSSMVKNAFAEGACSPELTEYLDHMIAENPNMDLITLADTNSVRLYHVVRERVGEEFMGGDQEGALEGESYFSDAEGTQGLQHRYLTPVKGSRGEVLGFIMVSTRMDNLKVLRAEIISAYFKMGLFLTLILCLVSALLSMFFHRVLLGFTPEELARTYLTQNDVFNNLDEGLLSVDSEGGIQMMNRAAEKILGQKMELLEDFSLDALIRTESGETLLEINGENVQTSRPNVLSTVIPLKKNGRNAGTTLILKDKSEAMRRAEQLNGTRHIISALRASTHEFMNKLQVISGLLQMDRAGEALEYIGNISDVQSKAVSPIMQLIRNSNVAALLLGKLDNARELNINFTLLPNSCLPEHSQYLSNSDLIAVVGNLLENAIEAINAQNADRPRNIELQITEDENGLLLMVSDTGIGIPREMLDKIYNMGFSTKAAEGRGMGMSLIHSIVERQQGNLEADSEPGVGTTFTLIFSEKRRGQRP